MNALKPETRSWLAETGFTVKDEALWFAALTHGSMGEKQDYERLEFLGDRVLGLSIADWLYAQSDAPEGKLAQRLNAIVSREMCATIARGIGLAPHIRISKQASRFEDSSVSRRRSAGSTFISRLTQRQAPGCTQHGSHDDFTAKVSKRVRICSTLSN